MKLFELLFNPNKANMVERVIQTISNKLQKHFDFTGKQEWVKILPKITKEYNNTVHNSIGVSPKRASEHPETVKESDEQLNEKVAKFQKNDRVLLAKIKDTFEKGRDTNFVKEVFEIQDVKNTNPITYQLVDKDGEKIHSAAYENELQKVKFKS